MLQTNYNRFITFVSSLYSTITHYILSFTVLFTLSFYIQKMSLKFADAVLITELFRNEAFPHLTLQEVFHLSHPGAVACIKLK